MFYLSYYVLKLGSHRNSLLELDIFNTGTVVASCLELSEKQNIQA